MSLFGTYIQEAKVATEPVEEAVLAIDEAAIFDFDYFGEAFQETIDECTNFDNAVNSIFVETVITEGFGDKAKAAIKKAIEKLGKIIEKIIAKIKGFINTVLDGRKVVADNVKAAVTAAKDFSREVANGKAKEFCKNVKFLALTDEFWSASNNFAGVEKLSFNYGYGDKGAAVAKKEDPDQDVTNRLAGAGENVTKVMSDESLCIKELTATSVEESLKNAKKAAEDLVRNEELTKKLLAYSNAAEAAKKKMEAALEKWNNIQADPKDNEQGATAAYVTTGIWKDIQVITKYISNIGKACAHLDKVFVSTKLNSKRLAENYKKFSGKEVDAA